MAGASGGALSDDLQYATEALPFQNSIIVSPLQDLLLYHQGLPRSRTVMDYHCILENTQDLSSSVHYRHLGKPGASEADASQEIQKHTVHGENLSGPGLHLHTDSDAWQGQPARPSAAHRH